MVSPAKGTGSDLYQLPSGVHKFMVASCKGYTAVEMKSLLYELNLAGDARKQLSNHLLISGRGKREIGAATEKIKEWRQSGKSR